MGHVAASLRAVLQLAGGSVRSSLAHPLHGGLPDQFRFEQLGRSPPAKLPVGYNIRMALYDHGLPRHAYTIDISQHAPEVIAAYKKWASLCLHPSKVEGFGMNVMECQIVGEALIE